MFLFHVQNLIHGINDGPAAGMRGGALILCMPAAYCWGTRSELSVSVQVSSEVALMVILSTLMPPPA